MNMTTLHTLDSIIKALALTRNVRITRRELLELCLPRYYKQVQLLTSSSVLSPMRRLAIKCLQNRKTKSNTTVFERMPYRFVSIPEKR